MELRIIGHALKHLLFIATSVGTTLSLVFCDVGSQKWTLRMDASTRPSAAHRGWTPFSPRMCTPHLQAKNKATPANHTVVLSRFSSPFCSSLAKIFPFQYQLLSSSRHLLYTRTKNGKKWRAPKLSAFLSIPLYSMLSSNHREKLPSAPSNPPPQKTPLAPKNWSQARHYSAPYLKKIEEAHQLPRSQ
ncbi:hypothetical protein KP509_05G005900 [Ceratopteris richardii]|uniref:Uncharacterized protein n=1 Tax=Ceratopteris richardii TaxID=49495 RepID=A0A8T2UJ53_CERRI|nr:hypothetical protein KP509_05G005900 [Ceratopteris richardii]